MLLCATSYPLRNVKRKRHWRRSTLYVRKEKIAELLADRGQVFTKTHQNFNGQIILSLWRAIRARKVAICETTLYVDR